MKKYHFSMLFILLISEGTVFDSLSIDEEFIKKILQQGVLKRLVLLRYSRKL